MFKDKIRLLLSELGMRNHEIADYISASPVTIGRYLSGARVPRGHSRRQLVSGLAKCIIEHDASAAVYRLLACDDISAEDDDLQKSLDLWLFADTSVGAGQEKQSPTTFSAFAERLGEAMELARLSNAKLAHMINMDPSQISRFRRGHRTPQSSSGVVTLICSVLIERIADLQATPELLGMIDAPPTAIEDENLMLIYFQKWLCDFKQENLTSIGHLLQNVNTLATFPDVVLPAYETIVTSAVKNDTNACYMGTSGLQNAVIRFLAAAIETDAKELLLYSDENIDWITADRNFQMAWAGLMAICVKKGIRIKIIHNIERSTSEMIDAIRSWFPLYMSRMIEPYYCTLRNGQRFSHTVFVCPNVACIESGLMNGNIETNLYHYHPDKVHLEYYENRYHHLLNSCRLLMRMQVGKAPDKTDTAIVSDQYDNISITINKSSVLISTTQPPYFSFVFLHPLMREAFREFVKQ